MRPRNCSVSSLDVVVRVRLGGVPGELRRVDRDGRGGGGHRAAVGQHHRRPRAPRCSSSRSRRAHERRKLPRYSSVWKATTSAPSRPVRICSRQGSLAKMSGDGHGTCRKNPTGCSARRLPDELRDEHQVVVVHPGDRVRLVVQGRRGPLAEDRVDVPVGVPPGSLEPGLLDRVVQQRPHRRVGEAVVVVADLRGRQPDRQQPDAGVRQRRRHSPGAAVPADPGTGMRGHHRPQRRDQAARRQLPARCRPGAPGAGWPRRRQADPGLR